MAGSRAQVMPSLSGFVVREDADDHRSTHFGLHLDGRFRAYARRSLVSGAGASDPTIRALAVGLLHCVDHVCVHPGQDQAGLWLGGLLRFVLAAIWSESPCFSVVMTLPAVGVPHHDLHLLGAKSGPDLGEAPASGQVQWLVPSLAASS